MIRATSVVAASLAVAFFVTTGSASAAPMTDTNIKNAKMVTIAEGDSLTKIADANGSTFERIFFANEKIADPDVIHPGDSVRVPNADEKLTEREIPANIVAMAQPVAPVAYEAPASAQAYQAPAPRAVSPAPVATVSDGSVWDRLAQCESGGNWSINTGNGYYGGLQFSPSSWTAAGGSGSPQNASREEQIAVAQNLQSMQGWGAWPSCSSQLGLR